tara:strand:- start:322 stop:1251 length:930 start_codon:yes stop_codon:yes gene_type:complete
MNNYYDILGVGKDSTTEEIKREYRRLSKEHHPDKGGDENRFKEISEAYGTLGNENKRTNYDNTLNNPFSGGNFGQGDFNEFFNRAGGRGGRTQETQDLTANIQVTLEEIDKGITRKIRYRRRIFDRKQPPSLCPTCNGSGTVSLLGPFRTKCPNCGGRGRMNVHKVVEQEVSFDVPKGISDGERIFYAGFGNETASGMGNLFITITQKPHPIFTREGNNLIITKEISFPTLIIGGSIEVRTLTGLIKVNVAEGTRPMERLRIAGKGLNNETGVGDLIVELKPTIPNKITKEERKLLETLKESENFSKIK